MAEVYKAYQPSLDRYVAIKVMHAFLARDPDFLGRFEREAKNVAALQHPNIIQVFDFDVHNGMPYMVMEFVEGGTLKSRIENLARLSEVLPLGETVRIVREIGRALSYAHQRSMIHRDIKPANMLLGSGGRVILSDFGIAKILTGPSFTMSGATMGTPAYMSPEQSLGQPGDHRSDIYALGVVLYQLGTGQLPYTADTPMAVMLKQVNEPLPNPRLARPDLPAGLERIILKALSKNPEDRFQSADELLAHLDNLETAARLPPVPAPQPVRPPSKPPMAGAPPPGHSGPPPARAKASGRPWFLAMLSVPVIILLCLGLGFGGLMLANAIGRSTPTPTAQATRRPTRTPAVEPTEEPTRQPTRTPADEPTETPTEEPTRQPTRTPTDEPTSDVIFEDDFSDDSIWETSEIDGTRLYYQDGQYIAEVFDGNWIVYGSPDMDPVSNISVAVTASSLKAQDATFGIICNLQDDGSFYYIGMGMDGYYGITLVDNDEHIALTGAADAVWTKTDAFALFEDVYYIQADCGADGTLRLYIDGQLIAEANDDTYTEGKFGLFAESILNLPVVVAFDDILVIPLE